MILFFKSLAKTIDESSLPENEETHNKDGCTSLTVWRKSLLFSCKGFTVIGGDGNLVYRVDCYTGRPSRVILMDGSGHPVLTLVRRKRKLGLVDVWLIFEGEEVEDLSSSSISSKKPVFVLRRNKNILATNMNVLAYVYRGMNEKRYSYVIEGSYTHRSCRILDGESRSVVAEIKKKEAVSRGGVSYGSEVFLLIVKPGFDSKFAMGFTLMLDQMFS